LGAKEKKDSSANAKVPGIEDESCDDAMKLSFKEVVLKSRKGKTLLEVSMKASAKKRAESPSQEKTPMIDGSAGIYSRLERRGRGPGTFCWKGWCNLAVLSEGIPPTKNWSLNKDNQERSLQKKRAKSFKQRKLVGQALERSFIMPEKKVYQKSKTTQQRFKG